MRNYVKIVKGRGNIYYVYDNDVYIVFYLVGYKIKNNILRIPGRYINKVKILLDKNNINYKIIDNYNIIEENTNKRNYYNKYLNMGIDKYKEYLNKEKLINKIKDMDNDNLIKISNYINYIIYK